MLLAKCDECQNTFPEGTILTEVRSVRGGELVIDKVCQSCLERINNNNADVANLLLG